MCGGFVNNVRRFDPLDSVTHGAIMHAVGGKTPQNNYSGTPIGQGTAADAASGTGEYALPLPWQQKPVGPTQGAPVQPRPVSAGVVTPGQLGQQIGASPYR